MAFLKDATQAKGKYPEGSTAWAEAPTAEPARPSPGPSVISVNVEMTGSLNSPDELHIYGTVDGNVRAGSLTICTGGTVKGDLIAETIIIHGTVEGRINGQDVRLCAGALVTGEITHCSLGIDTAAIFEGTVKRIERPLVAANAPDDASDEAAG